MGYSHANYTDIFDVGAVGASDVPNLPDGNTYYFVVTAYNGAGESTFSNEAVVTIPLKESGSSSTPFFSSTTGYIVYAAIGATVVILVLAFMFLYKRHKKAKGDKNVGIHDGYHRHDTRPPHISSSLSRSPLWLPVVPLQVSHDHEEIEPGMGLSVGG